MTNTVTTYINYFKALAQSHYMLLHDDDNANATAATKAKSKFVLFDNDEVVTGLRSLIGPGIILFLEIFTFRGRENGEGDYRAIHQGRFIIARKTIAQNNADLVAAYTETETVVWDFINRILYDSKHGAPACGAPFKNITLNDFSVEPVINLWDGRAGWVVDFTYQQPRLEEIDEDLATSVDIWTSV